MQRDSARDGRRIEGMTDGLERRARILRDEQKRGPKLLTRRA
jgi:hypothetical protein